MKNLLILIFALILGYGSFANPISGYQKRTVIKESAGQPVTFMKGSHFSSSIKKVNDLVEFAYPDVSAPDSNKVNEKIQKDFKLRFNDVNDALWISDSTGYLSYFRKNGFNDRAFYNKKGFWQYSLIYYTKEKLPWTIREEVKANYPEFDIFIVEELRTSKGMLYFVYLENDFDLKILKVSPEGEIEPSLELARG